MLKRFKNLMSEGSAYREYLIMIHLKVLTWTRRIRPTLWWHNLSDPICLCSRRLPIIWRIYCERIHFINRLTAVISLCNTTAWCKPCSAAYRFLILWSIDVGILKFEVHLFGCYLPHNWVAVYTVWLDVSTDVCCCEPVNIRSLFWTLPDFREHHIQRR
jgi:hypothetical protein